MNKLDLFIVTSAINTHIGQIDSQTRFIQTIATINSIKLFNPNSVIIVADASTSDLPSYMLDEIRTSAAFISYTHDKNIEKIHRKSIEYAKICATKYKIIGSHEDTILSFSAGYAKSMSELYLINNVLKRINKNDFGRIFKISGRYLLGNNFNRASHTGIFSILKAFVSNQTIDLVKTNMLHNTILWSFSSEYTDEVKDLLHKISNWIEKSYAEGTPGPDVEHGMYIFLKEKIELEHLGILGLINVPNDSPKFLKM